MRTMDRIVVTGGTTLDGNVTVHGAKNAVLKEMVSTILTPGTYELVNVPAIDDVRLMAEVLEYIGVSCRFRDQTLIMETPDELRPEAPLELVRKMRASIVVMGPLLAKTGRACVAFPGGDDLGARPIDMHLSGLEKMGATFRLEHGILEGAVSGPLRGAEIGLEFPSVGATENLLLAAVLAKGETVIRNAAREPEINDLVRQLREMGAVIEGAGTSVLTIRGVEELHPVRHEVVPDRIAAGTYLVAGAITGGDIKVEGCMPEHLRMELRKLEEAGCEISRGDDWVRMIGPSRPRAVDFATLPFPGFHTDMQPQMVAFLSVAKGSSVVTENLYDARFRYVGELMRMGADITVEWQHAVIRGVDRLSGCPVLAPDIRAGAALVLAGLRADGQTTIGDVFHIDRGYEDFVAELTRLGADIHRA
jgi:UDP-N-acetylglucosamine 1-carboxyvinyltransferase